MLEQLGPEQAARIGICDFLDSLEAVNQLHLVGDRGPAYKDAVRQLHKQQREERKNKASRFFSNSFDAVVPYFADGNEIDIRKIRPRIELVSSGTREAEIFRLASLTWSVPVSEGYGRRMRFLVWDEYHGKVIGIFALGDPVFNLRARDSEIGWSSKVRAEKLVNIMDAYVLGALPPYSLLLGGKLVACLIRTTEVKDLFYSRYGVVPGIISGKSKGARLHAVTTTSSLGRSSIYNRLNLGGKKFFRPIGYTSGFGHFHISSDFFETLRIYLESIHHPYASGNRFGNGPNWKFRAIRAAFESLGISRDILQHGVQRQVFLCEIAKNASAALNGTNVELDYSDLQSVDDVSALALERWIIPRGLSQPTYQNWRASELFSWL